MLLMATRARVNRSSSRRRFAAPLLMELEDRRVMSMLGQSLFPANNAWNQNIAAAPVAVNSTAIIGNIVNAYGNSALHPDFGQDYRTHDPLYGIPYNVAHGNTQPKVHVVIDAYPGDSDLIEAPIPAGAVLEGDYQDGPNTGVDNRGDSHLLVWDADHNVAYEFYRASRPSENADGQWHADSEAVWDMKTNNIRPLGYTSADAAGLSVLAGLTRPDEALPAGEGGQGTINHAIRFSLMNSHILDQYLYPASHEANSNRNAAVNPPMGSRFRLKAGVDISQLNPESKVIAQAMKSYGMILADNGSNLFSSGSSYSVDTNNNFALTWNDNDIQDRTHGLKSLHASDFEVVNLQPTVTGLSATSGTAGSQVTVIGQNFSGADGHLQVSFGSQAATSVSIVDDSHLSVVVPAGSGSVDVRVQSGVTTTGSAQNSTSPVFGYGISTATSADVFTYGTRTRAPSLVSSALASPSPATRTTMPLSVLGSDPSGESSLGYTWSVISAPKGATPAFSANGTNAAKSTTAMFNLAGSYQFLVTITNTSGLSTTSSVSVTLNQILTGIVVSPASGSVPRGRTLQLTAVAVDQFSHSLATQPKITWSTPIKFGAVTKAGLYSASRSRGMAVIGASYGSIANRIAVNVT